eukprot:875704-Amphidinium_carterae.1
MRPMIKMTHQDHDQYIEYYHHYKSKQQQNNQNGHQHVVLIADKALAPKEQRLDHLDDLTSLLESPRILPQMSIVRRTSPETAYQSNEQHNA